MRSTALYYTFYSSNVTDWLTLVRIDCIDVVINQSNEWLNPAVSIESWSSITNQQLNKTHFRQNNVIKIHITASCTKNLKFIVVVFSVHVWDGIVLPLPAFRINGGAAISLMYLSVSSAQNLLTEALAQQSPKVKHPSLTWTTRIYHHQEIVLCRHF